MSVAVLEGRRLRIRGTVQGVGFRPWVYRHAQAAGVTGRVNNDTAGVTIDVFGDWAEIERFIELLHQAPPPAAHIDSFQQTPIPPELLSGFVIVASNDSRERRVSIPPDLATCAACAAEIADPASRRYRYAFTNCTNCGPRFTIATGIPYDRAMTTMAPFRMCPRCRREYEDVNDRRFHAQPNACPECGPQLTLHTHTGELIAVDDPVASTAEALEMGLIVAIKGIGGFHLACDAMSEAAVALLRERKHRDEKPLAVMAADLAMVEAIATVDAEARRLLTSVERPIVLLPSRQASVIAANVAPRNRMIGVFLPYSPVHHMLLAAVRRPVVMTSGNLSEEPIACDNDEAVRRLGDIADLFLMHDRRIETRADDSVAAVVAGRGVVLRRSRGYVPRPIALGRALARPVLACGALLKNTFCFAAGDAAWLGPHIGDLENVETYDSFTGGISRLERFLQISPEIVAHDMHPDYLSSEYARRRPEGIKVPVQHHHAHVVSAMVEHGLVENRGRAIGIAYDGTGYGLDGTMWGAEVMVADAASFTRVATFRPIPLVGGDRAVREPWRIALALAADAFGGEPPTPVMALFDAVSRCEVAQALHILGQPMPMPLARGIGRYFDAFGAMFLKRSRATFEGQVALEWNQAADPVVERCYPFEVLHGTCTPWEVDLRPALRAAVQDFLHDEPVSAISAAFHNTLAAATADLVRRAANRYGRLPVIASGGCFQNARLAERVRASLAPEHDVRLHESVPPGDGGIALGQAVIADAIVRGGA
jgi:hydrogenase maturation protein HypF